MYLYRMTGTVAIGRWWFGRWRRRVKFKHEFNAANDEDARRHAEEVLKNGLNEPNTMKSLVRVLV